MVYNQTCVTTALHE